VCVISVNENLNGLLMLCWKFNCKKMSLGEPSVDNEELFAFAPSPDYAENMLMSSECWLDS
jgi:hypothetical protein